MLLFDVSLAGVRGVVGVDGVVGKKGDVGEDLTMLDSDDIEKGGEIF